ncbi:MAG TPA: endopeptidase La [Candidatus Brocadiia bacterium]|nr:endopeptidase La [Candidatus Brocadiales bacterium]
MKFSFQRSLDKEVPEELGIIPLKDEVILPHIVFPVKCEGVREIRAINDALARDKLVGFVTLKNTKVEEPTPEDLYSIGTIAKIIQVTEILPNRARITVEGQARIRITEYTQRDPFYKAKVEEIREFAESSELVDVLLQTVKTLLKLSVMLGKTFPKEILSKIDSITNPSVMADLVAIYLDLTVEERQYILETIDPQKRLKIVFYYLNRDVQLREVKGTIDEEVAKEVSKAQREFFLREQLKAIQKELGQDDPHLMDMKRLEEKIKEAAMPPDVEEVANKELERLKSMNPASAEFTVSRTYLDYLVAIPWNKKTEDNHDLNQAAKVLDEDHYGLEKVKERILEFLAVHKLKEKLKGPILCFVGPPGTGKTSLGKSIARTLGRKFVRMSLGGMRDEAEIRGHRRTYVGALPGRIMREICRAGYSNPVFMLDEVDKIGLDFRGDPASALLEVLDPEQNFSFTDHYIDVPFDLSNVFFITTANILDPVHPALKDRMEVISLPGYSEEEKLKIAAQFLIPKQIKENGLEAQSIVFTDDAVRRIIREYTREAGLRNLERAIASICRKVAKEIVVRPPQAGATTEIKPERIDELLGPRKFFYQVADEVDRIGVVTGLAWTEAGGDIIFVEASKMKGKSNLSLTGQLGNVMQESAKAALSYIRSNAARLGVEDGFFENMDIHLHVPSGAIPKDGPSAGIAMCMSLLSLLTERLARREVALTGEITLSGRIIPVGGIKEKVLAAVRAGVTTIVLPKKNEDDFREIKEDIRNKIKCIYIDTIDEAIELVLKPK